MGTETIRYALKKHKFKEVSEGKGIIEYLLVDEHGNERRVSAMANVGWGNRVSSVHPIHQREAPLINALAKTPLNETVEINFSEFNKKYPRGSARSKKMSIKKTRVSSKDARYITEIRSIINHKLRFLQLVTYSVAGFVASVYFFGDI